MSHYYCKHGTYIGDPYGPDHLCGYCESGTEPIPPRWQVIYGTKESVGSETFNTYDGAEFFVSQWTRRNPDGQTAIVTVP